MKQTLQLKLTQHLTLTPQLQQSIRLLQLSTIELNAEVERMLQENPLLEKAEGDEEPAAFSMPLAGPSRIDSDASASESPSASETATATAEAPEAEVAPFDDYPVGDSDWGGGSGAGDDDDGLYPQ